MKPSFAGRKAQTNDLASIVVCRCSNGLALGTVASTWRFPRRGGIKEWPIMCDYSLHAVASRAAEAGETLVVSGFYGTSSRGFASPAAPDVAVCLRPGTEIAFEEEACREGILFRRRTGDRVARFRHVDVDNPTMHHDALEFPDGTIVKLNDLIVGQRARIVQLPAEPKPATPKPQPVAQATVEAPEIVTA